MIQDNAFKLRDLNFVIGDCCRKISLPLKKDEERICASIKEAKRQLDCVIFSLYGHQLKGSDDTPDDFIVEMCHSAIDVGADVVFCHGSHVLRGIEVLNNRIIFYGLGDFVMKNELQTSLPSDFMEKYNVPYEEYDNPEYAFNVRSKNGSKGMCTNKLAWESMVVSIEFDNIGLKKLNFTQFHFILNYLGQEEGGHLLHMKKQKY